jgi:hypothetical protein
VGLLTRDKPRPASLWSPAGLPRIKSLTASTTAITSANAEEIRRSQQQWQEQALAYYEKVGELWFASQFYSRSLAKLEIFPAEKDPSGDWVRTKNADVIDVLDRIQDPGGGRSQMLSQYGRLMFLAGEAFLLGSIGEYGEQWEMLSNLELRIVSTTQFERRARPSDPPKIIKVPKAGSTPVVGDGVAYRLWRPSPTYSGECDSPVRAILELCEELLLLQRAVRARARSRLAGNGILGIPDDITFTPPEAEPDDDPREDPFFDALVDAMIQPIEAEGNASAVVPIVVRGDKDSIAAIKHITTHDPVATYPETGLRKEAIERIALGLDIPPEVLLGMSDANHWTAWQIDEQTWKAHLQPIAQHLVDELTAAYLRPELKRIGVDPAQFSIGYDAAAIINRPDRGKDAEDAYGVAAISDKAYRTAKGFQDSDAPSEMEYRKRVGVLVKDGGLAVTGIPTLRPEKGFESTAQAQAGVPTDGGQTPAAPTNGGPPAGGENPGTPTTPPATNGTGQAALDAIRLSVATEAARMRCYELAGSRIRSKCSGNENLARVIHDVPSRLVAAHLGKDVTEQTLGLAARALVKGGTDTLVAQIEGWGVTPQAARTIALRVELDAVATLFEMMSDGPIPVSH